MAAPPKPSPAESTAITPFGVGSPRRIPMKVLALGLGRTGTTSVQTALEILGFPTFHATDIWTDPYEHITLWNRAIDWKYGPPGAAEPLTKAEWDTLLGRYAAGTDVPLAWFGPELAEIYPDAKILILTRHDGPEKWFRSCVAAFGHRRMTWFQRSFFKTIIFWDKRMNELAKFMDKKQVVAWKFEWQDEGAREKALVWYEEYYDEMRRRIPEERRMEFTVADGWEPLCKFLEVPLPTVEDAEGKKVVLPFPRGNDAASFTAKVGAGVGTVVKNGRNDWVVRIVMVAAAWMFARNYAQGPLLRVVGMLRAQVGK